MKYINIYEYRNYREFLRDYHTQRKAVDKKFTHRYFAEQAGYSSSGFYSNVVHGIHNLTARYIPRFVKGLELDAKEAQYFELMVDYTHAQTPRERQKALEKMITFLPKPIRNMKEKQGAFYDEWYHAAILAALTIIDIDGEHSELAEFINPQIKPSQAKKSLALLTDLELITQNPQGYWKPSDSKLFGGEEVGVFKIHQFQSKMMELAGEAQQRYAPRERYITTKTISASRESLSRINEMAQKFSLEVDAISHADIDADQVYQFNVQYFPLSKQGN